MVARAHGLGPRQIPEEYWAKLDDLPYYSPFWATSDIEFDVGTVSFPASVAYYGVRFRSDGVDALVGPAEPPPAVEQRQPPSGEDPPEETSAPKVEKKDLPQLLLDEWAVLFRKAYPAGPEKLAEESVAGMFPRHKVGRPRLRAALKKVGTLDRGRPKERDGD